jgi:hypothetical protein
MSRLTPPRALALLGLTVLLLLLGSTAWAVFIKTEFYTAASASQANTAVTFGFQGYVLLINDGPNSVHVSLVGTVATVSDFTLKMGESLSPQDPTTGIGLICATAETATVRVLALERGI